MLYLRKSRRGFTLIELMVVVAIIGVLALLGLRVYTGQQQKAKNAVVKANVGTVQTLIQAELADATNSQVNDMVKTAGVESPLIIKSGINIPDGVAQTKNGTKGLDADIGKVYVIYDSTPGSEYFKINGNGFDGKDVFAEPLIARK